MTHLTQNAYLDLTTPLVSECITREQDKSCPQSYDFEETYHLLRDFGIRIRKKDIPQKNTVFDLHLWRIQVIKKYL